MVKFMKYFKKEALTSKFTRSYFCCFSGFSGLECLLYGRGEAKAEAKAEAETEAQAEAEAEARRRRGEARRRRRLRAAVINDAFPRPHAIFQIFYSKSYF